MPDAVENPNTFAWYCCVMKFNESIRNTWSGAGAPQAAPKGGENKQAKQAKEAKPA